MKEPRSVDNPGTYPTPQDSTYLAARWNAMTQPMGPLDEGDQALVNAVNRLPAIIHEGELEGNTIKTFKDSQPGGDMISVNSDGYDKSEMIDVRIRKNPRTEYDDVSVPDISARLATFSGSRNETVRDTRASGNRITEDGIKDGRMRKNRAAAQLFKLEIAGRIDQAREHANSTVVRPSGRKPRASI